MPKLSTMNLSMQSLDKWKQERRSLSRVNGKSNCGNSNIEKECSTSSRPENKAEEHMDWEVSTPTTPLSRSRSESVSDSSSDESFTSAQAQPVEQFDSEITEKEEQNNILGDKSERYSKILELTTLGLKMCENEKKIRENEQIIRSLQEKVHIPSSDSTASEIVISKLMETATAVTETQQLHDEILTKIAILAGESQLITVKSQIGELERSRLQDKKEIGYLKQKMAGIVAQMKELQNKEPRFNGTKSNGSTKRRITFTKDLDEESEEDGSLEEIPSSSDDGKIERRVQKRLRHDRKASLICSQSSNRKSSSEEEKLSVETNNFIDECNLKMRRHGLLHRNVLSWAENRVPPLLWNQRMVGSFLNKKMKEEECLKLLDHFKEFLDDMMKNLSPTRQKRSRLETVPPVSYAECSEHSESRSDSSSSVSETVDLQSSTTSPLSGPTDPLEETQDSVSVDNSSEQTFELSTETNEFIDDFKSTMDKDRTISYKTLIAWSSRDGNRKLDVRSISHFMHKRMKEKQCQELIPLMKRYLEDHEKEKKRKSNNISAPPQEKVHENGKRFPRCVFSSSDREILEESFKQNQFPSTSDKVALGKQLKVATGSIKNWFKTRRRLDRQKEAYLLALTN